MLDPDPGSGSVLRKKAGSRLKGRWIRNTAFNINYVHICKSFSYTKSGLWIRFLTKKAAGYGSALGRAAGSGYAENECESTALYQVKEKNLCLESLIIFMVLNVMDLKP